MKSDSGKTAMQRLKYAAPSAAIVPRFNALADGPRQWAILKSCWRLERSGNFYLASKKLEEFARSNAVDPDPAWLAVAELGTRLFGAKKELFAKFAEARNYSKVEHSKLVQAYQSELKPGFRDSQFLIFSQFFEHWNEFSQVYLYVSNDLQLPINPIATSSHFEGVRTFYASTQEFFSQQITLITALSNIIAGRRFDELKHISLDKYRSSDNSKRRENFITDPVFSSVTAEYDSGLRNAIAHNWISISKDASVLEYKEGGKGPPVKLPYAQYLLKCVTMFKQVCWLMQIEHLFDEAARHAARELLSIPRPAQNVNIRTFLRPSARSS